MRTFYGITLNSPLMLGTAQYPSPAILAEAFRASEAAVATVSLRRESGAGQDFWALIRELGVRLLPNTAGCHTAREAVTTAQMARELFQTNWIKLEVIGNSETLQPDPFELLEAARLLGDDGFEVFPYTTEDLVLAERLVEAGCRVLMPWGSPIGSGLGLNNTWGLRSLRAHFPDVPLVVDAGIGCAAGERCMGEPGAARCIECANDAECAGTPARGQCVAGRCVLEGRQRVVGRGASAAGDLHHQVRVAQERGIVRDQLLPAVEPPRRGDVPDQHTCHLDLGKRPKQVDRRRPDCPSADDGDLAGSPASLRHARDSITGLPHRISGLLERGSLLVCSAVGAHEPGALNGPQAGPRENLWC